MIIADYWMGRDAKYPAELTREIELNAADLVGRCNLLARELPFPLPRVTSGWRPPAVNAGVKGAAKKSNHMTGNAVDFAGNEMARWCFENQGKLERIGLWLEHPDATVGTNGGWTHVARVPPKSGRRTFRP